MNAFCLESIDWWSSEFEDQVSLRTSLNLVESLDAFDIKLHNSRCVNILRLQRTWTWINTKSWKDNKTAQNLWNLNAYYCSPNDYFMHETFDIIGMVTGRLTKHSCQHQDCVLIVSKQPTSMISRTQNNPRNFLMAFFGFWGSRQDIL